MRKISTHGRTNSAQYTETFISTLSLIWMPWSELKRRYFTSIAAEVQEQQQGVAQGRPLSANQAFHQNWNKGGLNNDEKNWKNNNLKYYLVSYGIWPTVINAFVTLITENCHSYIFKDAVMYSVRTIHKPPLSCSTSDQGKRYSYLHSYQSGPLL